MLDFSPEAWFLSSWFNPTALAHQRGHAGACLCFVHAVPSIWNALLSFHFGQDTAEASFPPEGLPGAFRLALGSSSLVSKVPYTHCNHSCGFSTLTSPGAPCYTYKSCMAGSRGLSLGSCICICLPVFSGCQARVGVFSNLYPVGLSTRLRS